MGGWAGPWADPWAPGLLVVFFVCLVVFVLAGCWRSCLSSPSSMLGCSRTACGGCVGVGVTRIVVVVVVVVACVCARVQVCTCKCVSVRDLWGWKGAGVTENSGRLIQWLWLVC